MVEFFVIVTIPSIAPLWIFSSVVRVLTIVRLGRVWSPIVILSWCMWIVRKVVRFFAVWLTMMIVVNLIILVAIIFVLFVIHITRISFCTFYWLWVSVCKATIMCYVLVSVSLVDSSGRLRISVVLFLLWLGIATLRFYWSLGKLTCFVWWSILCRLEIRYSFVYFLGRWMVDVVVIVVAAKFIISIPIEVVAVRIQKATIWVRVESLSVINSTVVIGLLLSMIRFALYFIRVRSSWCMRCLLRLLRQVVLVSGCDMRLNSLLVNMLLKRRPCLVPSLILLRARALGLLLWKLVLSSLGLIAFGGLRIGLLFLFSLLVWFMQCFGSCWAWLIAFFTSLFLGKFRG